MQVAKFIIYMIYINNHLLKLLKLYLEKELVYKLYFCLITTIFLCVPSHPIIKCVAKTCTRHRRGCLMAGLECGIHPLVRGCFWEDWVVVRTIRNPQATDTFHDRRQGGKVDPS